MNRRQYEIVQPTAIYRQPTPDDKIEEMEVTKPARYKPFGEQITWVIFLHFSLAYLAAFSTVYGIGYYSGKEGFKPALIIALGMASTYSLIVLWLRVNKYDHEQGISEWVRYQQPKPAEPKVRPYIYQGMGKPEQIVIGKMAYEPKQWRRLGRVLKSNDWKVTRRALKECQLFPNITDKYPDYIAEFSRAGWLPEGSEGNDNLTDAGIDFFMGFISPTPSDTGVQSGATGPTTTATTATTGGNRA